MTCKRSTFIWWPSVAWCCGNTGRADVKRFTLSAVLLMLLMSLAAMPAAAQLEDRGITTFDPATGLEWLDLDQTTNISYPQMVASLEPGGMFEGWRHATEEEVRTFWTNAGIGLPEDFRNEHGGLVSTDDPEELQALMDFQELWGVTRFFHHDTAFSVQSRGITSTPTEYIGGGPGVKVAHIQVFEIFDPPQRMLGSTSFTTWSLEPHHRHPETGHSLVRVAVPNEVPIADAGQDIVVECTGPDGTWVTLDGTGSWDPDGDEITFFWSANGIEFDDETSPTPSALFPIGATTVTLVVTDERGDTGTADVIVIVQDTIAPTIEIVEVSEHVLWPPNHRMVPVTIAITVNDACEDPENLFVIVFVSSDEPDDSTGDGHTTGDVAGQDGFVGPVEIPVSWDSERSQWIGEVELRAERIGGGNGRTYSITCLAMDHHNNYTISTSVVLVPANLSFTAKVKKSN